MERMGRQVAIKEYFYTVTYRNEITKALEKAGDKRFFLKDIYYNPNTHTYDFVLAWKHDRVKYSKIRVYKKGSKESAELRLYWSITKESAEQMDGGKMTELMMMQAWNDINDPTLSGVDQIYLKGLKGWMKEWTSQ
jgi:hypothetical protein